MENILIRRSSRPEDMVRNIYCCLDNIFKVEVAALVQEMGISARNTRLVKLFVATFIPRLPQYTGRDSLICYLKQFLLACSKLYSLNLQLLMHSSNMPKI